jgi:adenine-specific DNA-methyltransferase
MTIESIKHKKSTRAYIPSKEEAGTEDANPKVKAKQKARFPKNPVVHRGQDPELFWMHKYGKNDAEDTVSADIRSLYRHEHIAPETLISSLYRLKEAEGQKQMGLFSVPELFGNGLELDEIDKVSEYYEHQDGWTNRLIQGDSLLVMTSLLEREGLAGKVQMIYMDPPYGIKYGSNWQMKMNDRNVTDGKDEHLSGEPEQIKAYRDTWELGIHSYLGYLRDRLLVAKELLTESGSCFVQISDENVHLVRCIMDEVFGSVNFCSLVTIKKTSAQTTALLSTVSDYLLWYSKHANSVKYRQLFKEKKLGEDPDYRSIEFPDGTRKNLGLDEAVKIQKEGKGKLFRYDQITSQTGSPNTRFEFEFRGKKYKPAGSRGWSTSLEGLKRIALTNRLIGRTTSLAPIRYYDDYPVLPIKNIWDDVALSSRSEDKLYVVQTSIKVIARCLLMTTDPGDLVLDPTCGSGTTAFVAEQWGRRWISTDTSRIALNIAKTRLMTATYPYYVLHDEKNKDIRQGFIYKKVPHITLKSIANNTRIDDAVADYAPQIKKTLAELNKAIKGKTGFKEWEVPFEPDDNWPEGIQRLWKEFRDLKQAKQKKIDDIIAEDADQEILYDQPQEDKKRLRVSGPFTVETLQSFEPLPPEQLDEGAPQSEHIEGFEQRVFEHLMSAGIKTGIKEEKAVFVRVERISSAYLHAEGFYHTDAGEKKAYLHIGPKFGTVSKQAVNEAVKECRTRGDADWLIILGFSFESNISGETVTANLGSFNVTKARMHDDLLQEGLLKKDKKAASFVTIGEPDITLRRDGNRVQAEILGLDIYDPVKNMVKPRSVSDIAYWMVDEDYDGSNFVVRQVFFCGGKKSEFQKWQKGLDTLARTTAKRKAEKTLKIELDDEAFDRLYGHISHPIEITKKDQKIAVRVVSQFGEESTKVLNG